MGNENVSFKTYLERRIEEESEKVKFFSHPAIQKSYFTGAYARAVILSSYNSPVSEKNTTFKKWLSNQIINYKNLNRIFTKAFRFEEKLQLRIRNDSEVRRLAHEVPVTDPKGISNAKISFAFIAGFDDYRKFLKENPITIEKKEIVNE